MNKTKINTKVVGHSVNEFGDELVSVLCTFPRIILSEVNTHRMLSKNTSSSRAIPFNKMVEAVQNNPFIPIAWQKHHSGMQGTKYFTDLDNDIPSLERGWLSARDNAIESAKYLNKCFENEDGSIEGLTKQLCNRLLEPFMWTTMLITGSREGWDNFFKLRCPVYELPINPTQQFKSRKDAIKYHSYPELKNRDDLFWLSHNKSQAEIHMMQLAECIWDGYNESTPKLLKAGEWYLPMLPEEAEYLELQEQLNWCVGIHANTSYTLVGDGRKLGLEQATKIHDKCKKEVHSSVFEHCAVSMTLEQRKSFVKGLGIDNVDNSFEEKSLGWVYNIKGFIPYRYLIDNNIEI